jgi:hypothetical protein
MFEVALMTLHFPQDQCRQRLAAASGMGTIVLLRVHNAQAPGHARWFERLLGWNS